MTRFLGVSEMQIYSNCKSESNERQRQQQQQRTTADLQRDDKQRNKTTATANATAEAKATQNWMGQTVATGVVLPGLQQAEQVLVVDVFLAVGVRSVKRW